MSNRKVLEIVLYALTGEMNHRYDRKQRLDLRIRIDDRDLRIFSDYKHTAYDIIDAKSGRIVAIQPADDSLTEIDTGWLNKECETYYK
jgi:hypothetical protein